MAYDLPLALEQLTRTGRIAPTDDWGPCAQTGTPYTNITEKGDEGFAANWRGVSAVPTEAELQAAYDAAVPANAATQNLAQRTGAKAIVSTEKVPHAKVLRAVAEVLKDEINLVRKWTRDFKTQVAAATNLANLQTRVATLPTLDDRTLTQAKQAILDAIDSGNVD